MSEERQTATRALLIVLMNVRCRTDRPQALHEGDGSSDQRLGSCLGPGHSFFGPDRWPDAVRVRIVPARCKLKEARQLSVKRPACAGG